MFETEKDNIIITVLGKTFNSEEDRREYFREELRKHLPELKKMEGFPIGEDDDIINLSDPPFYTACPNPWLNDFIGEWEEEKKQLEKDGKRDAKFKIDEPYAADVSEGKNNPIYTSHSYHTKVPHPAIMRYILHYTQPGDIIFDGFAGTGMTGVAASQCAKPDKEFKYKLESTTPNIKWGKRNSVNIDLSPLATFISSNLNSDFDASEMNKSFMDVLKELFNQYKWLFTTKHSKSDNLEGIINYCVWSQCFSCPSCNGEIIFWNTAIDHDLGKVQKEFNCPNCQMKLKKRQLIPLLETFYDSKLKVSRKRIKLSLELINYSVGKKRFEKKPDSNDLLTLKKLKELLIDCNYPTERLPEGDESRRNDKVGLKYTHDFYTDRNLFILSKLWDISNNSQKFYLTSVIGRNLCHLNRYIYYKGKGGIGRPMSGTLYVSSEIIEQSPFSLLKSKKVKTSWEAKNLTSINSSKSNLIENNSIDYIYVDPPFGANIMYSELSFITESWLKIKTNNHDEAIENKTQGKGKIEYQNIIESCFKEFNRILKPGKWMTVEFSNTSAAIWNVLQVAINNSNFIISDISSLDKKHGGIRAMTYAAAVKQDLIISCYKPSSNFDEKFKQHQHTDIGIWDFIEEHLHHLQVHLIVDHSTTAIIERSPKILFDRLIAFYVQKGLPVPIDAGKFQKGLRDRFIERDGMFFTNEQVQEYDKKKAENPEFIQLSILVSSEQDGVLWLKNLLTDKSLTYQDIQPLWMQALAGVRKGDVSPELADILEENFLKDNGGKWYAPDPENEADLEKLRTKRLLKQFETYKTEAAKPKAKKIKEVRVEALRAGFKQCYQDKDFASIVSVGDKIPNNLLMEDEVLLQFYDIASTRV
jgi:DNA modification methylase